MDFKHIPSYASEYEFIVCYKEEEDPDICYFYTVAEYGFMAELACKEIENNYDKCEPLIIHNVRIQGHK